MAAVPDSGRPALTTALAAASVVGSYAAVRSGRLAALDARLGAALSRPRGAVVDRTVGAATDLGSVYGAVGAATALAGAGRRRLALDVLGAAAIAWSVAQAIKPLLGRERPYETAVAARLVAVPAGTSWPSGHAAVAAAIAAAVAPGLPSSARLGTTAAVGLVGASRCYVGVHHPSDVVAGVGVGVLSAAAWRRVAGWWRRRRPPPPARTR
jgi:membrane-associated phospholipid phosphatase